MLFQTQALVALLDRVGPAKAQAIRNHFTKLDAYEPPFVAQSGKVMSPRLRPEWKDKFRGLLCAAAFATDGKPIPSAFALHGEHEANPTHGPSAQIRLPVSRN